MAFDTSFLPSPSHVASFKQEAKARFFGASDKGAIQRNQIKMLDALDFIANELAKNGWAVDEQAEYLDQLLRLDVWANPAALDDCADMMAFVAALESSLDAAEAQERIIEAQCQATGTPSPSEVEATRQWIEALEFSGSEKQIKWAKNIALAKALQVHVCRQQGREIPTSAKWWIENRDKNLLMTL